MHRRFLLPFLAVLVIPPLAAADEPPIEAARKHLAAFLRSDAESLLGSYAEKVLLQPGHEFLKPIYGLTGKDRAVAATVNAADLVKAIVEAAKDRPARGAEQIDALLEILEFEDLEAAPGKFAAEPADPGGRLAFQVEAGDKVVKVSPGEGDFLVFHLRSIDGGAWRVVSEYLD